ncbi:MAG: hypothetical protein IVW57_07135 [Ktedonobacterales bacterium]|nr:hypothetical protein [Ktedonobacterales bacterium]
MLVVTVVALLISGLGSAFVFWLGPSFAQPDARKPNRYNPTSAVNSKLPAPR